VTLFRNKYRVETTRLPGYDYASPGWYYITICTKDRAHYFGEITGVEGNAVMNLSEPGRIAETFWNEIPYHFRNVELDEFVIMPNHMHGIIHIVDAAVANAAKLAASTAASPATIGIIINQFKRICTITCNKNGIPFAWQSLYWDRIIRDMDECNRVRNYIRNNPKKWQEDKLNDKQT
jgi:putative transposase